MTQPADPAGQPAPAPTAPVQVPTPPVAAPTPQPPATALQPPPVPTAPQGQPGMGDDLPYFQEGVPWRQLPADQQVAYWMHRSRTHETRTKAMSDYEQLKADQAKYQNLLTQTQTERERDIAEARRQGEQSAMGRTNVMLAEAYVRSAAAARGVDDEAVTDLLDTLDLSKFVNPATGQVDTAKVYRQVNRLAPAPNPNPQPGVPAVPAVPQPPMTQQPPAGWPQQQVPQQYQQQAPGQPAVAPQWYGQQPVPAAPQWPGQVPAAPVAPGQPAPAAAPDFGQGVFTQAPPSGLEAGKAAARARFGSQKTNSQAA